MLSAICRYDYNVARGRHLAANAADSERIFASEALRGNEGSGPTLGAFARGAAAFPAVR